MKKWYYENCAHARRGTMICASCSKSITEGEYRYREGNDDYILLHRSCTRYDPIWVKFDIDHQTHLENIRSQLTAYVQFRDKWHTTSLDKEIEELMKTLKI
jgi:hypothetical protein